MTHEWHPERVIDVDTARRAIADQFPELADLPVRPFDSGWDNVVYAVDDEWLFRFVHRSIALPGAARELAVLEHLADGLSLPIPHPRFVGRPSPDVPWPFWGTRRLPGRELAHAGVPDGERGPLARSLGRFLRELHQPDVAVRASAAAARRGIDLPVDPLRRADATRVAGRARALLGELAAAGIWQPDDAVDAVLDAAEGLGPPTGEDVVLVHGDLHVRHVLVHEGRVSGVIDWGDTALADPAVDLMIAFAAFGPDERRELVEEYGPLPPERELRARAMALWGTANLVRYAAVDGLDALRTEALAALGRAAS